MRLMTSPASALVVLAVLLMHAMPASAEIVYSSYAGGCLNTANSYNAGYSSGYYCNAGYSFLRQALYTCYRDATCPSPPPANAPPPSSAGKLCHDHCANVSRAPSLVDHTPPLLSLRLAQPRVDVDNRASGPTSAHCTRVSMSSLRFGV